MPCGMPASGAFRSLALEEEHATFSGFETPIMLRQVHTRIAWSSLLLCAHLWAAAAGSSSLARAVSTLLQRQWNISTAIME